MKKSEKLLYIVEKLQSVESGKNYGPLLEVEVLASLTEELSDLANELISDKLQELAEEILKKNPSVYSVCDAQGLDRITWRRRRRPF